MYRCLTRSAELPAPNCRTDISTFWHAVFQTDISTCQQAEFYAGIPACWGEEGAKRQKLAGPGMEKPSCTTDLWAHTDGDILLHSRYFGTYRRAMVWNYGMAPAALACLPTNFNPPVPVGLTGKLIIEAFSQSLAQYIMQRGVKVGHFT